MLPEVDVATLCQSVYRSCLSLARVRENVNLMVKQYVGDTYSENGSPLVVPINTISLYHRIVLPKLVADNPRYSLSTWNMQARPTVSAMEDVANEVSKRINLGATLERVASGALFSNGWLKVGITKRSDAGRFAYQLKEGSIYAQAISVDDIAYDIHAKSMEELAWIGNRFRVAVRDVQADPRFNKRKREVHATEDKIYTEMGIEKTAMITRGYYGQGYELEEMVDLWEIYVPKHNVIVILDAEDIFGGAGPDQPLLEEEWIGPKGGMPILQLGYGPVPDNILSKAPIADIFTLHEDLNNIWRKLIRQAKDQKKTLPVPPGMEGGAKKFLDTNNGEAFECSTPELLKELNTGGPDAALFQFAMTLLEKTDWIAGNLSALGGLAPQAKTLGQEKLVTEASSASVADMQRRTVDFARRAGEMILWYLWEDPETVHDQPFVIESLGLSVDRKITPQDRRKLPFAKLKLDIDPYSMQSQTPIEVDAMLTQIISAEIGPILPVLAQQGYQLNAAEWMKIKAKLRNRPELLRIFSLNDPVEQPTTAGKEGVGKPANTTRTYDRISRSDRTQQGEANAGVEKMYAAERNNGDAA